MSNANTVSLSRIANIAVGRIANISVSPNVFQLGDASRFQGITGESFLKHPQTESIDFNKSYLRLSRSQRKISRIEAAAVATLLGLSQAMTYGEVSTATYPTLDHELSIGLHEQEWGQVFDKVDSLATLENGWNGYNAPPPNNKAIDTVRRFLNSMQECGNLPTRVAASAVGGVGLTRRNGARKAYVEFLNSGLISALFADDANKVMHTQQINNTSDDFDDLILDIEEYLYG